MKLVTQTGVKVKGRPILKSMLRRGPDLRRNIDLKWQEKKVNKQSFYQDIKELIQGQGQGRARMRLVERTVWASSPHLFGVKFTKCLQCSCQTGPCEAASCQDV